MKPFTYDEAKKYAIRLKEDDLWIFRNNDNEYNVIRGFAYDHYAKVNKWIPVAHITLKVHVQEMFTGVIYE